MKLVAAVFLLSLSRVAWADESRLDLSVAAGASNTLFAMPGMEMRSTTAADYDLAPTGYLSLRYRISDRVVWSVPTLSFAYLGGTPGDTEWIPWGGLTGWGAGYSSIEKFVANGQLGAGFAVRHWMSPSFALNVTADARGNFDYRQDCGDLMCDSWTGPKWFGSANVGISVKLGDSIEINAGVGGSRPLDGSGSSMPGVSLGSVQQIALRQLPLIEARLNSSWFLDGFATVSHNSLNDSTEQRYLVGFTHVWAR